MNARNGYRKYAKDDKFEHAVDMTTGEAVLWPALLALRESHGLKFRARFGRIADFWCPSRRVIVEVDGGYHSLPERTKQDEVRDTALFRKLGIVTVRVSNESAIAQPQLIANYVAWVAMQLPKYKSHNQRPNLELVRRVIAGTAKVRLEATA